MITHEELMRYLDGELPPERVRAVEEALETDTELRREYVIFRQLKEDLSDMGETMEMTESVWAGVNRRVVRPGGWILVIVTAVVWAAYGAYAYLTGGDDLWEKLATSALVVGFGMLLLSVLLDRLRDLKTDPYRDIQR